MDGKLLSGHNQSRTGFKRRQRTALLSTWLIICSVGFFVLAGWFFSDDIDQIFIGVIYIVGGLLLILIASVNFIYLPFLHGENVPLDAPHKTQIMMWCEVEDIGHALSVKFGPLTGLLCGMAEAVIPYSQIKGYHEPRDSWEGCCAYGVGKVNICVGVRQHSLCSCDCKQKQLVIEYKTQQELCCKPYDRITIAVNGEDWQSLLKLLDEKCSINAVDATATI